MSNQAFDGRSVRVPGGAMGFAVALTALTALHCSSESSQDKPSNSRPGTTAAPATDNRGTNVTTPPWEWRIDVSDSEITAFHPANQFTLHLLPDADTLTVSNQDQRWQLAADALQPRKYESNVFDHADEVRRVMAPEGDGKDALTRLGGWFFYRDELLFAFRHESWPMALATYGFGNGWVMSIDDSYAGMIMSTDFESAAKK